MKFRFRDTRGSAMVEMALTTPLFMLLIFGSFELGRIAYFAIEVQSASRAGASYGSLNPGTDFSTDATANTIQAAKNDAPDLIRLTTLTVSTPVTYCVCETLDTSSSTGAASFSRPVSCGDGNTTIANCKGGSATTAHYVLHYVKVDTQATVDPLIHLPGLPGVYTLYGSTRMRLLQN